MLNEPVVSIPYPCSAAKKLVVQSLAARFSLGSRRQIRQPRPIHSARERINSAPSECPR